MPGIFRLKGTVKHYDWGGSSLIPALLQTVNKENKPFAEYWMGIHPSGTALVETADGQWKKLTEYSPRLPYLLKVLDVKSMLSVQVHPSKQAAEKEFARENAAGIPLDSPQRNYKDDNHKPEMIVALGDFWLLHGFKPPEELVYTLLNVVELRELLPVFNESGYTGLYKQVMEMPQAEVNRILQPLIDNINTIYRDSEPDRNDEDHWVADAAKIFTRDGNIDRGIFSIYLFNLVHLKKGEGIFQAAGVPHAYLEGQNVEIMANSDNVLRGGLTTKHVDVQELLKHVKCEATYPQILTGEINDSGVKEYATPAPDFKLDVIELMPGETVPLRFVQDSILMTTDGTAELNNGNRIILLRQGFPAGFVEGRQDITVSASAGATIFRASAAH